MRSSLRSTGFALALCLSASSLAIADPADERPREVNTSAFKDGEVVAFEIPEKPGETHEYFRFASHQDVLGVAAVHVGAEKDAMRTEMRLDYFPIKTRVMHVERQTPTGPRLIWRETRPRSGRTVMVDWGPDGESLTSVDWSGRDALRQEELPEVGALLPLYLINHVREGQFLGGRFDIFNPISNRVEEWTASVKRVALLPTSPNHARRLVLTRADGSLAGEYIFVGKELLLFRLQRGGPVAVRTDRAGYDAALRGDRERRRREAAANTPSPASTRMLEPRLIVTEKQY